MITALPNIQTVLQTSENSLSKTHDALKSAKIIPEVLDDFEPSCELTVYYPQNRDDVNIGNFISPSHVKKAPRIGIVCPSAQSGYGSQYTVALTDPDVPSRDKPKGSEMCHWIATIPGELTISRAYAIGEQVENGGNLIVGGGQKLGEVVEYKPPAPPKKTGPHRYVFVLLEGDNTNLTAPSERSHWGTGKARHGLRDWAKQEGLKVVGANFFYAKNKKQ